jgi:hypothetical protein
MSLDPAWKDRRECVRDGGQWRHGRCVELVDITLDDQLTTSEPRSPLLTIDQAAGIASALTRSGVAYVVLVRETDRRGFTDRPEIRSPEEFVQLLMALDEAL